MNHAVFIIHPVLQDLSSGSSKELQFWGMPAVKDLIESIGIPHVEVGNVKINNQSVLFEEGVKNGDEVMINPVNWRSRGGSAHSLQPESPEVDRFILDVHLGKLARTMRLFGLDTLFKPDFQDQEIIDRGGKDRRFILTRDKDLLKQSKIDFGHWMRNTNPQKQMDEILLFFDIYEQIKPFSRCLNCNGNLKPVEKAKIIDALPPRVQKYYDDFQQCESCKNIYWKGSHYERMVRYLWKEYGIECV